MRALLVLSLVVAAACTPTAPPTREPDTTGLITHVSDDGGTILVEERPQDVSGSAKTSLRITSDTRVWRLDGNATRAGAADLRVGIAVRVWIDGPIATSYPGQAKAGDIAIDPKGTAPGLYVVSRGAPDVTVSVSAFEAARVACNAGAAIRPRADGTPDLPWDVVVRRRSDGHVLLTERVTELPRWLVVERDTARIVASPLGAQPYIPCP